MDGRTEAIAISPSLFCRDMRFRIILSGWDARLGHGI